MYRLKKLKKNNKRKKEKTPNEVIFSFSSIGIINKFMSIFLFTIDSKYK